MDTNEFTWVPLFKELAQKILSYQSRQLELIQILNDCSGDEPVLDKDLHGSFPLKEIDPFTFFALLLKKGKTENRNRIFQCIKNKLGLKQPVPQDYHGIPNPNAQAAWFFGYKHKRKTDDIDTLWRFALAAQNQSIDQQLWKRSSEIFKSGSVKLTQGMFWMFPDLYLPVNKQTKPYLDSYGINSKLTDWASYQSILSAVREKLEQPFCQISYDAFMFNPPDAASYYERVLTAGAIKEGNIQIPAHCEIFDEANWGGKDQSQIGREFQLDLPDGKVHHSDLRRDAETHGGRIRSRFAIRALFEDQGIGAGTKVRITKIAEDHYRLSFTHIVSPEIVMPINEELLALAVNEVIRPFLIDQKGLYDPGNEGYHHARILPQAKELLSRQSLERDPIEAVRGAIGLSGNLLFASTQQQRPKLFLDHCDPKQARQQFMDLLYGEVDLTERVRTFLQWSSWDNKDNKLDDKPVGFDYVSTSYLLNMVDPLGIAFCYPGNYIDAVKALLGKEHLEYDMPKRIQHATDFYKAALKIFREEHNLPFTDLMHVHIAFWVVRDNYAKGWPGWSELMNQDGTGEVQKKPILTTNHSLNTILYGPPGTGKTYKTAQLAVEIIDGQASDDRESLMNRYRQLRNAGRIEFITFHQSYSYEEFVEGIRPVLVDSGRKFDGLQYELREGVFKKLSLVASGKQETSGESYDFDASTINVYKLSLGDTLNPEEAVVYERCIESGQIALGYGWDFDYSECDDRSAITDLMKEAGQTVDKNSYEVTAVNYFKNVINNDDIVVVTDGNLKFRAIGRVTGGYEYDPEFPYAHVRKVRWLKVYEESLPYEQLMNCRFQQQPIYYLSHKSIKIEVLYELVNRTVQGDPGNAVLIIDEINRGNVSKILGELITLLEPDKRIGKTNELRVQLPYSGDDFGVPSNLYVIGTMNTADRSIAFIDTALRRRFKFTEVMPDTAVVRNLVGSDGVINGINIAEILELLNRRIEALYDRDHQLGHSFFLKVTTLSDLRDVFVDKVIPLLQEYFHENWAKLAAVLNHKSESAAESNVTAQKIVVSKSLDVPDVEDEYMGPSDNIYQYEINPKFIEAAEDDLAPFFNHLVSS